MSTIASTSPSNRNSLLRLSVIGGLLIGILHLVIQAWIVFILILKLAPSFMIGAQYVASGVMGDAAYTGGFATALLGVILEILMTIIIAGIFIFSADRIPLLRRYIIPGSLLYGFGVFIVMNFVVLPLSAAAVSPPPPMWLLIEIILEHMLLIGLPLGLLVQRNANANK
jgi:hypothetical protein